MKSCLKITFIAFYIGKYNVNINYWLILNVFIVMAFIGCKKDLEPANPFPVNTTLAKELIDDGFPVDVAEFFAASKIESNSPNDTTYIYLQTFPNGASREMTLRVSSNRQYTPTPEEIANTIPGSNPIYAFKYSSDIQADSTTKIEMNYFVPNGYLTNGSKLLQIASGNGTIDGLVIHWEEIGKKGADVSISSLLEYFKAGYVSSIYALASALSDVTTALDLSKQYKKWKDELDALEDCAANPTNPLTRSDPNYSPTTVAKIRDARDELQQVTAVRFLNLMTEKAYDLNPVTAIFSIPAKQGFVWSEKTLDNYSENTIMREARLAVVPCDNSWALVGKIDVLTERTDDITNENSVEHITTNVKWVLDPTFPCACRYVSQGNFTYDYTDIRDSCTFKGTASGNIGSTGFLASDPGLQQIIGFDYYAAGQIEIQVDASSNCGDSHTYSKVIDWLPLVKANLGPDSTYAGETSETNISGTTTVKVKWSFSVTPSK